MKMTLLLMTVAFLMPAAAFALPAPAQGAQIGPSDSGTSTTITPRHLISRVGTIGVGGYSLPFYTVPVGPPQGSFPVPPIPSRFPAIRYHLTAHQAAKLGVYLIRGESLLLAPRGLQEAYSPRRGTDGNLVVRLENPSSPRKEWISISSIPACGGCAYDAARSWLPWVKRNSDNSWCGDGECKRNIKPGLSYARLGKEVTAISYESPYGAHVNGIVLYSPNEDNPVSLTYESAWFYAPTLGHQIATAVLNFFYKYDIRQQHLLMVMSSRQLAHSTVGNAKFAGIVRKHKGSEHYDIPAKCQTPPYGASEASYLAYKNFGGVIEKYYPVYKAYPPICIAKARAGKHRYAYSRIGITTRDLKKWTYMKIAFKLVEFDRELYKTLKAYKAWEVRKSAAASRNADRIYIAGMCISLPHRQDCQSEAEDGTFDTLAECENFLKVFGPLDAAGHVKVSPTDTEECFWHKVNGWQPAR